MFKVVWTWFKISSS